MEGNYTFRTSQTIGDQQLPIKNGSFQVKVYDIDGNVVAQREIGVSRDETLGEIADKFAEDIDDNEDNVNGNDIDDILNAQVKDDGNGNGVFRIDLTDEYKDKGYTFAIEETDPQNPTDFAGALGLSRFFDGWDEGTFYQGAAKRISLSSELDNNPTLIGGNATPVAGDNQLANRMVQLQYDKVDFYMGDKSEPFSHETFDSFFRASVTDIANVTAAAHTQNDSSEALLNSVVQEFDSISKVDIDEELTNLMKYQTGYSAAAKVITTVDQMIQTLLNIKQ
jgi:flagellar hook-associated protein 1 FlgK